MTKNNGKEATKTKHSGGLLYIQVIIAIILGAGLGHFFPSLGESMKPLGDGFIKLVKMIITPVIFLTITTGIAHMSDLKTFGTTTLKTFLYFFFFSTIALFIGALVANITHPGHGLNIDPSTLDASKVSVYAQKAHGGHTLTDFVIGIIPDTFTSAFTDGNILQVLLISVLFGVSLVLTKEKSAPVVTLLEQVSAAIFKVVNIVMKVAPIGAFGAFAFTIGKYGIGTVINLAELVATFYLTSFLFVVIVLGAVLKAVGFNIFSLLKFLKTELLLVLGTSSSEAALPKLMEKMEAAGCKREIVGLVVPTGYSFNLDGTNIYMTLSALFIAQAMNIHLSFHEQVALFLVAMLSSKGAAGVTGAGFITLAATLSVVPSVPVAGIAIILGVDRFMSECRALTNFIGNAVATIVISKWQKGLDAERMHDVFSGKISIEETQDHEIAFSPAGLNAGEKDAD